MLKRIVLISLVVVAAVTLAGGYFYLRGSIVTGTDPLKAVDDDAIVIVRTKSITGFFSTLHNDTGLLADLETVLGSRGITTAVSFLDSLFSAGMAASDIAAGKSLCFSLHQVGRDRYDYVFYVGLSSFREIKAATELMQGLLSDHALVSERLYDRARIYDATFQGQSLIDDLSWTVTDGLLIVSFSPLLIENSVSQLRDGENILENESFQKVFTTSGSNVDANISVNLRLFPVYISSFADGETKNFLSGFTSLAEWAELDLHLRGDALLINGFLYPGTGGDKYMDVFKGQSPVPIGAESVIPSYSSAFMAIGLSDMALFYENFLAWLEVSGGVSHHEQLNEEFAGMTGKDAAGTFHSIIDGEASLVFSGWEEPGGDGETFLLMKTVSRSLAAETLLDMVSHHARRTGNDAASYRQVYNVDRETSYNIYRFPFKNTGELLFGKIFAAAETSYYTFVDNYLVFGESAEGLSEFIHASVLNQNISADNRFREFSEYLSSRNNFFFYSGIPRSAGLFTTVSGEQLSESLTGHIESFRKFQALSLQFSSGRDMIYNNIFLKYSPRVIEEPRTEWQTLLDTVTDFKPLLLVNHNTGENEIFVQDINHTIYLINRAGRILWKRPLPGKIKGTVYQIDYYNNSRLQMLFNTREQIFLVDRNGNDVDRYPLQLPSPATNGISLFDYDNNKDYRIFVACEDKSVVVRSKEGNVVSGWNFPGSEHPVYHEIEHFRVDGRDYIVFNDRHRVYILDRRGNTRVSPGKVFPVSPDNGISFEGRTPASDPRMVITDTLGMVWHIYFDGRTEPLNLGDYSSGHFFDLQDVNASGYREYIFLDNNRLDVYDRQGSLLFSREFQVTIDRAPSYYYFSRRDRKLGVVSQSSGQIFLINPDGEIYKGFPLDGRSDFTIGFLQSEQGNFHLIVGSDYNFLYNYIVY
ncbi:MAG: hypothetical protein R6U58_00405 [Bacteroidales bacterium]